MPGELEPIFEAKLTEVMSRGCASADGAFAEGAADEILEACEKAAALVLGPGIGRSEAALDVARRVAAKAGLPLVLDADGLNAHAGALAGPRHRAPEATVITPHAGELGRLLGKDSDEIGAHRLACAREAAERGRLRRGAQGRRHDRRGARRAGRGERRLGARRSLPREPATSWRARSAPSSRRAWSPSKRRAPESGRTRTPESAAAERVGAAESVIASDVIDALPAGLRP